MTSRRRSHRRPRPTSDKTENKQAVGRTRPKRLYAVLLILVLVVGCFVVAERAIAGFKWRAFDEAMLDENPAAAITALNEATAWSWTQARTYFAMARVNRLGQQHGEAFTNLARAENAGYAKDAIAKERLLVHLSDGTRGDLIDLVLADADRIANGASPAQVDGIRVDADVLATCAASCLSRGRGECFVRALAALHAAFPSDVRHHALSARASEDAESATEAIGLLQKSLSQRPRHLPANLGLAEAYSLRDEATKALMAFERVIAFLEPHVANGDLVSPGGQELLFARVERIELMLRCQRKDQAIELAEVFLESLPDHFGINYRLAKMYQSVGRESDALELVEKLLRRHPSDLSLHYLAATSHARLSQTGAVESQSAATRNTNHAAASKRHMQSYFAGRRQMDRAEGLASSFESESNLAPQERFELAMTIATIYRNVKWDRAKSWYQQAIEIQPTSITALQGLATCYRDLGDFAMTQKCVQTAMQLKSRS